MKSICIIGINQGYGYVKLMQTRDPDLAATAVCEVLDSGMGEYIPYSLITFLLILGLIVRAPLLSPTERERIDHIKLLLLSSLMLHLLLLGIAVLLRFVGPVHLSVKRKIDKLNSSPTEKCF